MQNFHFRERRKFPRFPFRIMVFCIGSSSNEVHEVKTSDISTHGLKIISDVDFSTGSKLDLCIHMPDNGEVIHVGGDVVWSKKTEDSRYLIGISISGYSLKAAPMALRSIQASL